MNQEITSLSRDILKHTGIVMKIERFYSNFEYLWNVNRCSVTFEVPNV